LLGRSQPNLIWQNAAQGAAVEETNHSRLAFLVKRNGQHELH
jgi:hypothetical protein